MKKIKYLAKPHAIRYVLNMNKKNVFTKLIRGAKYRQIIKSRANRVIEPVFYGASALRAMYRNLDMATVTEFSSPTATDYSMSYGDKKIATWRALPNFTVRYGNITIEKSIQDLFYARGGNRAGWGHFLKLSIDNQPVDLVKNKGAATLVKDIGVALVESGRIKGYAIDDAIRDDSWVFTR